jgi:glutamate racemase
VILKDSPSLRSGDALSRPIGVFDSGLGGLTVFKALARRMPEESLIYFGDTAHVPYGSKSKEAVAKYSTAIARFLVSRGVKAIVVACNTSSALALREIEEAVDVPVIGVIEGGVRAAAGAAATKRIGVIGTEATVLSGAYQASLKRVLPDASVFAQACPLFVPLVEEGWWDHTVTTEVAREYLKPLLAKKIDSLILGCTHYPLLKKTLQKVAGKKVSLIDSAEQTAIETDRRLTELGLRRRGGKPSRTYFVSDAPRRFLRLSKRFLGTPVARVSLHAFDA